MGYRQAGSDAGNQKHIAGECFVYNEEPTRPLLDKPEEQYKVHLENLKAEKPTQKLDNVLPNVAIYSDGRQRSWEYKNGRLNKIVHADGQVWTRQDKKHWNISYHGKLIGKNVELANVKIENDKTKENYKTLSWTIGGVKKSLSGTGEFHDPTLMAKKDTDHKHDHVHVKDKHDSVAKTAHHAEHKNEHTGHKTQVNTDEQKTLEDNPLFHVEIQHAAKEFSGTASWYGDQFHGRPTSSGKIFDMNQMTAAHKTLPFGTKLLVTDKDTGKTAVVTVTDRGPFHGNRVLDLSKAAARKLNIIRKGVTEITYKVL